jgi:hypothetical protein
MDYNTQREKLNMPEYGRYVQKMVQHIKNIPDKEKRNEQARAVVQTMSALNPQLREIHDFKHKIWDHLFAISDFDLDVDSPYPTPTSESFRSAPNKIELEENPLKVNYYGRNIQNIAQALSQWTKGVEQDEMVMALAYYMRKQYLIWNKDSVSDQTIFDDISLLSKGCLRVPDGFKMDEIQGEVVRQAYLQTKNGQQRGAFSPNPHRSKKRRKKQQKQ